MRHQMVLSIHKLLTEYKLFGKKFQEFCVTIERTRKVWKMILKPTMIHRSQNQLRNHKDFNIAELRLLRRMCGGYKKG